MKPKHPPTPSSVIANLLQALGNELALEVRLIPRGSDYRISCDVEEQIQPLKGFWFGKVNYTFDVDLEGLTTPEVKDKIREKLLLARRAFLQSLKRKFDCVQTEQNLQSPP